MRDSIVFYRSYYEIIKELPDEQKLKLYEAIFEYGLNDDEIELDGILHISFHNLSMLNLMVFQLLAFYLEVLFSLELILHFHQTVVQDPGVHEQHELREEGSAV